MTTRFALPEERWAQLVREWSDSNPVSIEEVARYSRGRWAWNCDNGHSWQTRLNHRVTGHNCPICAGNHKIAIPIVDTSGGLIRQLEEARDELTLVIDALKASSRPTSEVMAELSTLDDGGAR